MDLREASRTTTRHPWEVARFRFFSGLLRDAGVLAATRQVLDVGAGDAWFAKELLRVLPDGAHVDCVDAHYDDSHVQADLPPGLTLHRDRPAGTWDLVLLLDVLEHVPDDVGLLRDLAEHALSPGGRVLISVPAWQGLFTSHDRFLHHHRRYAPAQARAVIRKAGLHLEASGGLFHGLLAPRALGRLREAVLGPPQEHTSEIAWPHGRMLTAAVQAALAVDNRASRWLAQRGMDVPGLSWWALCRK